jgi:hypothetical protein
MTEEEAMRRHLLITAALMTAMAAAGTPTRAGGVSWLGPEDPYQVPGNDLTVRTAFYEGGLEGTPSDGPFYAYLLPGWRGFDKPGPVPARATPLGPITIRPATGSMGEWVATLTFTVPTVRTGLYGIDYCNEPCTVEGLGDVYGGSFWIGQTEHEARLAAHVRYLEHKISRFRHAQTQLQRVETRLAEAEDEQALLITRLRVAALQAASASARGEGTVSVRETLPPWVSASLVAMALLPGAWYRRHQRQEIPDVVPDDLVREVESQVPSRQT